MFIQHWPMLKTDKIQTLNIYSASVHFVLYIFPLPGCFFPISLDNNIVDLKKKINPDSVKYQNLSTVPTFLIALIRGRTKGYEGYKVFFFFCLVYILIWVPVKTPPELYRKLLQPTLKRNVAVFLTPSMSIRKIMYGKTHCIIYYSVQIHIILLIIVLT